jgi:hypothetical protein
VDCRVFVYEGNEYEQPPVAMIVDGVLKAIYGQQPREGGAYTLPDNLERFFAGKSDSLPAHHSSATPAGGCCGDKTCC